MNRTGHKKSPALGRLLLEQLLLTALVLCVFALFHHVIPDWRFRQQGIGEPIGRVEQEEPEPDSLPGASASAAEAVLPAGGQAEQAAEAEQPPEEEDSWKSRFAEHFSDTVIRGEREYKSPDISVTVTEYDRPEGYPRMVYYVADIYLADISCFRVGFPLDGTYGSGEGIAADNNAVLAINGDSMLVQHTGLLVRNGDIYCEDPNGGDLCVLYGDGTMETYFPGGFTTEEILARSPLHCWQFGPALLDENGDPLESFNISPELREHHPRTAMGYFEPGHYCFVVVDGRDPARSDGAQIAALAQIMADLGCTRAYNLDGGASSMMILNGQTVNAPARTGVANGYRYINDMVILAEPGEGEVG